MRIGWGTIAYGLSAGACAGLALVFLSIGARRGRFDPLMVSVGVFAAAGTLNGVATVRLHLSSSVSGYEDWIKVFGHANLATIVAMVLLVAAWTQSVPRWAFGVFAIAGVPAVILQFGLPNGLIVDDVTGLREVTLFGEAFVVHEGTTSPWRPAFEAFALIGVAISITALVRGFRRGRRAYSVLVAFAVAVAYTAGAYDGLVDFGTFSTTYFTPFGVTVTALAGAAFLAERSVRADMRLEEQAARLEATVIERTAALIESNRRLEAQLDRQRRSTRSLASLTAEFERVNAMVDPTRPAIEASLHALLDRVATILPAASVELRIDDERLDGLLPTSLSSPHPTATHDPDSDVGDERVDQSEPINIGDRAVGELVARSVSERGLATDTVQYLGLTAEHLAGLIHRLELVGNVTDTAIESERQRIAMDLHDSVTQRMYSVSLLADAAAHQASADPTNVAGPVRRIRELVLSSLAELRALLLELRPQALDETDLGTLIEQLADNLDSTCEPDVVVDIRPVPPMPVPVKTALYRISQEALSNACRHSQADLVTVTLHHDRDTTTLRIHDDGIGFDAATTNGDGAGLDNLRTRAVAIGADLDIASRPDAGTTITLRHRLTTSVAPRVRAGA